MDDLTLMREFRAERVADDPQARADAWRALEARLEMALAGAAPPAPQRRGFLSRRGRLLAFAATSALAAAVAGVLVLSSGPTAEPAAAEILHRTAAIAAATDAPAATPGPGQFFYRRFERLELEGWLPAGAGSADYPQGSMGAPLSGPDAERAFTALVPTTQQWWLGADGAGRVREVAGAPRFLTNAEGARWKAAGSPLPAPFDPAAQRRHPVLGDHVLEQGRGVLDTEHPKWKGFHFPDNSSLPIEPEALRHAVESRGVRGGELAQAGPTAKPLDTERTIAGLFDILVEGISTTPQLRAAAFNALAELPGIAVDTGAADFLGRRGDAIRLIDRAAGSGTEFIFDPATSELLAQRDFITEPATWVRRNLPEGEAESSIWKELPAGLTIRETAYLEAGVVDATDETTAGAEGSGPDPGPPAG